MVRTKQRREELKEVYRLGVVMDVEQDSEMKEGEIPNLRGLSGKSMYLKNRH